VYHNFSTFAAIQKALKMALAEEFESQGNWLFKYRSWLPLVLLIAGAGVYSFTELNPEFSFSKGTDIELRYEYLCLAVGILGLMIRVFTVGFTPRNTSGRNVHGQVADVVNTKGIYATVRHPLYLGNYFMWLAPAMLPGHTWFIVAFTLAYWLYYERIMFAEEQFLRKKFGNRYTDWAAKVPAFIPNPFLYKKSEASFNYIKVIRNEKNGIVAIFFIFAAFEWLGAYLSDEHYFNNFFLYGLMASLAYYVVVKVLIKTTKILEEPKD